MTEKSLHDLPTGDAHLKEECINTQDLYGGIFLNMKRDTSACRMVVKRCASTLRIQAR